ncbi:DUF6232 family protein [Streptomyces sp. CBMA123]|uniref:DUF6232 family protein n=1 Tax=Streptomyces sp. CBMA123 TaxID=1896313 RepID=UPI0016619F9B|nr:DUF6232 family protein [Streptomyces sp. CBMA123]MBD0693607.1 hypothetical protein [Streptomyces sp. CBMA123]
MPGYDPSATRVAVTNRILWIGTAAYPLATIARVSITIILPDVLGAIRRFLKFIGIVIPAALVIAGLDALANSSRSSGFGSSSDKSTSTGTIVVVTLVLVVCYFLFATLPVLLQQRLHALTVDTAGPPTALLAWKDPKYAYELQARITHAIENPKTEFQQFVSNVVVDLRRYQFGDNVNIYGGQGNTGVIK